MASLIDKIKGKKSTSLIDKIKGDRVERGVTGAIAPTTFEKPSFAREKVTVDLADPGVTELGKQQKRAFEREQAIKETERKAREQAIIQEGISKFASKLGKPSFPSTVSEAISKPFTAVSRATEAITGAPDDVTKGIAGAITGATRQVPLIGRGVVSTEELQRAREEAPVLGTFKKDVPFVGGKELTPVEIGSAAAALGFTASQYSQINKILGGLGTTSKLGKVLGGSKLAKFGATQAVDLLADVIIQTPGEVLDAIEQDKTLGQAGTDFLKNRGIDVLANTVIGGAIELPNLIRGLKQVDPSVAKQVIDKLPEGQAKTTLQQQLGTEAFLKSEAGKAFEAAKAKAPDFGVPKDIPSAPSTTPLIDKIKGIQPDVAKTDVVEPIIKEQPMADVATKAIKEEPSVVKEIVSPRTPDFAEPIIGTSKSPFIERIQDFTKKDPTTAKLKRELSKLDELPTTSNEARTLAARQVLTDNFEGAVKLAGEGRQFGSRIESEIARLAVDELQRLGRHAESVELIAKASQKFRAAGKDVQAASMWAKTSPEGMQKWAVDTLENADVKVDQKLITEIGNDMRNINAMTPEELAKMVAEKLGKGESDKLLNSIQNSFSFEQLKATNTAITMQKVIDKVPVLKARKLSTAQAMSHLLNPRTFLRNIGGNTISIGAEILSRTPASVADRALSMFTGNRTLMASMPKWKKSLNEGWNQGKRSFFEIQAGVGRGKSGKYEALFGNTFKSKIGKTGEKLLSLSLQTPDEFFKGFTKADSLFNQVQARLGKDVRKWSFDEVMEKATAEEIQQAIKETEFVTFQNDSMLADLMSKTKKGLNSASTAIAGKVPGFKGMFTEDFGLGDMVLKYTRVPGNIITRGFEYSPLGYVKAADNIVNLMKHGTELTPQMQRELSMQIGRATTGTGLLALGMKLNDLDIITGAEQSRDYDVGAFDRAEGLGNYKINTDALRRLASGQDPTPQSGDNIESMNWLQPLVTPIAVGARLSEEKPGTPQEAAKALAMGTFEEAMDLPTLWIIKKMFYESMSGDATPYDVLSVPVKEAIPGFVPSTVRQISQVADPTVRETKFGANIPVLKELTPLLGKEATGKIQSNIPFASKKLLPKIDVLGQEQTRTPGVFPNLISPSTRTTFEPTSYGDKLRQVSDLTGQTNIFPDRKPPTTTTSPRGEKVSLTPEESVRWQQVEGQFVDQEYAKLLNRVTINTEQDALRVADALEKIKREAGQRAKADLFRKRGE